MDSKKIILARKTLCLTQLEASSLIHVTQKAWQQWESGVRKMHPAFWELFTLKTNYKPEINTMKVIHDSYTAKDIKLRHEELANITHQIENKKNRKKIFKFIDLFSGIGGIRSAFESVGGGCVFSSEIDSHAQFTYYTNYGVVPYGDIEKIDATLIPEHDVLCAGFPCQPFSHIGKREGFNHPTQGTMFHEILSILEIKKTKVIFLENVPGLINHDEGRTLNVILNELKKLGYNCFKTVLDSSDYGVPQNRKRFYLVGFLDDVDFSFPTPPELKVNIGDFIESNVKGYTISKHLQKSYLFKKDDGRPNIVDESSKGSIKTLVSTYHKIQRLTGTFVKGGETGLRLLTTNECKSVMGFPNDFVFPVSRTQMYRQMGNSVVIPVIESIAKEIVFSLAKSNHVKRKQSS